MRRLRWALPLWLAASLAFGQATTTVEVVEFYHEGLDHYFITADPEEIRNLDTGVQKGWVRTNHKFVAGSPAAELPGASAICRFYGQPERGLDSHFYPANLEECVTTREKYHPHTWFFESDNVFKLYLPDQNTGVCPATTTPVYRAYNDRADVNHRYTTDRNLHLSMLAKGYKEEGFGGNGKPAVAMCALSASNPVAAGVPVPECTIAADNAFPKVGGSVTLTATCTNSPTKYVWSETLCASASGSCTLTGSDIGYKNYTVKGGNTGGDGVAVGVLVQWQPATVTGPPPAPTPTPRVPSCTIVASTSTPVINNDLRLTASCTGSPTAYTWTGCPGAFGPTCTTRESTTGNRTYTVTATNAVGNSSPTTMTANWLAVAPPVGVNCTLFANPVSPVIGEALTLTASCTGNPTTFAWVNCSSTNSTCMPTPLTVNGSVEYILTASNASGSSHAPRINVTWRNPPLPPPPAPTGCLVVDYPTFAVPRLAGLFMTVPNVAIRFRTPNYASTRAGRGSSSEYIGEQRYRQATISHLPCDFSQTHAPAPGSPISFGPGAVNFSPPATSTLNWFTVGTTQAGKVQLELNTVYYYNLRGVPWEPDDAREQFMVVVDLPLP